MALSASGFGVMIVDMKPQTSASQTAGGRSAKAPTRHQPAAPAGGSTTDEMSECSFPASDPPSVWTWEVMTGSGTATVPTGTAHK